MSKHLYCPTCKEFPDDIIEIYTPYWEKRTWNEEMDCYELSENNLGMQEPDEVICTHCETKLEEK